MVTAHADTPHAPVAPGTNEGAALHVIACAERARQVDRRAIAVVRELVKWLLIAAIVAVPVVAIAMPSCTLRFPCRAKQSEAKGNLKALYVAQESYRAEFDRYTADQRALGWTAKGARLRYAYFVKIDDASALRFEAWAIGVDQEVAGDVWRIDEENALVNAVSTCTVTRSHR